MEAPQKGSDVLAPTGITGQFEGRFHCFGPGVAQEDLDRRAHRGDRGQFGRQLGVDGQIKIRGAVMQQLLGLGNDRRHNLGLTVSGRINCDPGTEI